jgi:hypothetical protein
MVTRLNNTRYKRFIFVNKLEVGTRLQDLQEVAIKHMIYKTNKINCSINKTA